MRYLASAKLEIIQLVEQSHLPAKRTLDQLSITRRIFYRWYDRYLEGGPEALADRPSAPSRVWNRIPPGIHDQIIELALEHPLHHRADLAQTANRLYVQLDERRGSGHPAGCVNLTTQVSLFMSTLFRTSS